MCEELLESEFGEKCHFDVVDTIKKLEKLGIVLQVRVLVSLNANSSCCTLSIANTLRSVDNLLNGIA